MTVHHFASLTLASVLFGLPLCFLMTMSCLPTFPDARSRNTHKKTFAEQWGVVSVFACFGLTHSTFCMLLGYPLRNV